ncbi:NAD-dependent epimerase/dehydratase family protein [Clostridium butyricum]|uniref:NAD-dependent epimerase/dehydratase family protein n=1 Tax=Clostridium butyricum TaxID=1492 RepID=UPI00210259E4|nr:NAD-dependent epimerase/dehydratase family protein [Clostridium butyricum]MCQ2014194.1 NAD-dependent epimerase/dehydratase family protein [Clostridium butyricum]MCQ2026284.1 NAD-dependent epimerase/dehydratase family protein [Clostridium butyricum]
MWTTIVKEDLENIYKSLSENELNIFNDKKILITGYAGSLGYMLLAFFKEFGKKLKIKKVYGIDNYIFGTPKWLNEFEKDELFELKNLDITNCNLEFASEAKIIFHMASLASPVYYRLHPIETIDADVVGLRRLLDFYKNKSIHNLLFFSTSEIYGNPVNEQVPTDEQYWGNVNTSGPRACYDESKRFGETLCYNFNKVYNVPITVIRPFNSFGPGLRTNDKRVVADFAENIIKNEEIVIYSDGKATRTFCYVSDTISGIIKCSLHNEYNIFNIGYDKEEINIDELSKIYREIGIDLFNYNKEIIYRVHEDKHYLTDNPQRRCPNIDKAKRLLGYFPSINTVEGVRRYIKHLIEEEEK